MKGILEVIVSVVLHPIALVLAWVNIVGRSDLGGGQKLLWAVVSTVWGVGPLLYVSVGGGTLW